VTTYKPETTTASQNRVSVVRNTYSETKSSWMTTEFWAYVGAVVAVAVAAFLTDSDDGGAAFGAERALLYVSLLTIGYMISRGLAKAGSRELRGDHTHTH